MFDRNGVPIGGASGSAWREAERFLPAAGQAVVWRVALAALVGIDGLMLSQRSDAGLPAYGLAYALAACGFALALALLGKAGDSPAPWRAVSDWRSGAAPLAPGERMQVLRRLVLALCAAAVAGVFLRQAARPLLAWLGLPDEVAQATGVALGLLCTALPLVWLALARGRSAFGAGLTQTLVLAVVLGQVLNMALNLWLIDGLGGWVDAGAGGVAASTLVVWLVMSGLLVGLSWFLPWAGSGLPSLPGLASAEVSERGPLADRAAPALAAVATLPWLGLALAAAGLGVEPLRLAAALGMFLASTLAVGLGLAQAGGQRVAAARAQSQRRPATLRRVGQRCALFTAGLLGLLALAQAAIGIELVPLLLGRGSLANGVQRLLPLALAAVLVESLARMYARALVNVDQRQLATLIDACVGLGMLLLGSWLASSQQMGLAGLLTAWTLAAMLRLVLLARQYGAHANELDIASVDAVRRRAQVIANGWADTVVLIPADAEKLAQAAAVAGEPFARPQRVA